MGKTKINWATMVWNPVVGCTKVSEGCRNCYAKGLHDLRHKAYLAGKQLPEQYAKPFEVVQLREDRLEDPLHWKKPQRVFVNSVSDLFHPDVPFEFIDQVFAQMANAYWHTFIILTKRPKRMYEYFTGVRYSARKVFDLASGEAGKFDCDLYWPLSNVWLGVSVEDQAAADERIPWLLETPAAVRFISCEPLLGPVHLLGSVRTVTKWHPAPMRGGMIDWVIAGGESGPGARPMHPDWARGLRDQCQVAGVPFFMKQWGEYLHENQIWIDPFAPKLLPGDVNCINGAAARAVIYWNESPEEKAFQWDDRSISYLVGKKAAGRVLDGREWNEFPGGEG